MNNRRTKLFPKIVMGQIFVGIIMATMAFSILFFAEGYRINIKRMSIYKTGIVSIVAYPKDAQIYVDSTLVKNDSSFDKTLYSANLRSGYYNITVLKEGYTTWEKNIKIESGQVKRFSSIILFKENAIPEKLNDQNKINLLLNPNDILASKQNSRALISNDTEIWFNNSLITRFSTKVLNAVLYPDKEHILVQLSNQIRILDIDGSNDNVLVELKENLPTQFITNSDGNELYYRDGSDYMFARIR